MTRWLDAAQKWKRATDETDDTDETASAIDSAWAKNVNAGRSVSSVSSVSSAGRAVNTHSPPFITANGLLRTWTGRDVHPDEWGKLSDWERFGSRGKVWNAIIRSWEQLDE